MIFITLALNGAANAEQIKIQKVHYDAGTRELSVKAYIDGHSRQDRAATAEINIVDAANPR